MVLTNEYQTNIAAKKPKKPKKVVRPKVLLPGFVFWFLVMCLFLEAAIVAWMCISRIS